MESSLNLLVVLLYLLAIGGLVVGVIVLYRANQAKTARTQALFGVGGAPGMSVVLGKRTYTWPDRVGHYVTFQSGGAAPVEVEVSPEWYAFLNPGDRGQLSLQGGLFHGFARVG